MYNYFPRQMTLIALMLSAIPTISIADVYKCVDKGKVIYTDAPCPNPVKTIRSDAPPTPQFGYRADQARAKAYIKKNPDINPVHRAAIEANVVVPGMTVEQVKASIGEPTRTNLSQGANSSRWQWVYIKNGKSSYVYIEEGIVTGTN
jgi:hypothetical protein